MDVIRLKGINQIRIESGIKVNFDIQIKGQSYDLWYRFYGMDCDIERIEERFDGIAVLFLYFALCNGLDLESDYPMSEELYYSLTRHVIPHIHAANRGKTKAILIKAPLINEPLQGDWVGTGVSCGVDSLSAIYEYTHEIELDSYKVDHLVYLKIGQHAETLGRFDAEAEQTHFSHGLTNVKGFCKEMGLPLVVGESNFNEVISDSFGYSSLVPNFTFRNAGSVMLLQNYFAKYMYATSYGDINHFKVDVDGDIAYYERWLLPLISNKSVQFHSANGAMERVEKTQTLVDFKEAYNHLSVCWRDGKNCGYCTKCIRTLLTLDLLGALDHYKNVFNLNFYHKRKRDLFAYAYIMRKKNSFFGEIIDYMSAHDIPMPSKWDIFHVCMMKLKNRCYPCVEDID